MDEPDSGNQLQSLQNQMGEMRQMIWMMMKQMMEDMKLKTRIWCNGDPNNKRTKSTDKDVIKDLCGRFHPCLHLPHYNCPPESTMHQRGMIDRAPLGCHSFFSSVTANSISMLPIM